MPDEETDSDCSMEGNGETQASKEMAEQIYQQQHQRLFETKTQNTTKPRIGLLFMIRYD